MLPIFRSDLKSVRDEQRGIVLYRIEDPKTQTTFRLYEIEYLIAKKMDGTRTLDDVIASVKREHNFEISSDDLKKFVAQLQALGFVQVSLPTKKAPPPEPQAKATEPLGLAARFGASSPAESSETASTDFDRHTFFREAEVKRASPLAFSGFNPADLLSLIRSTLLHIRQGELAQAREFLLAAREMNPADSRLLRLAEQLERAVVASAGGSFDADDLYDFAIVLFPDAARDSDAESKSPPVPLPSSQPPPKVQATAEGPPSSFAPTQEPQPEFPYMDVPMETVPYATSAKGSDRMLRVILIGALSLVLSSALWLLDPFGLFHPAYEVQVASVQSTRAPISHSGVASDVSPVREEVLAFSSEGQIDVIEVRDGDEIVASQILARLRLHPRVQHVLDSALARVARAKTQLASREKAVRDIESQRNTTASEQHLADNKAYELTENTRTKPGDVHARAELETWERMREASNRRVAALANSERSARLAVVEATESLAEARLRLESVEARMAAKMIRAPFTGQVVQVGRQLGDHVDSGQPVMVVRSRDVQITFVLKETQVVEMGAPVYVSVEGHAPFSARIASVDSDKNAVVVATDEAPLELMRKPPEAFRFVKSFTDTAFRVPDASLVQHDGEAHVIAAVNGRAVHVNVKVLEQGPGFTSVADLTNTLRAGDTVVVGSSDGVDLSKIRNGATLDVVAAP